MHSVDGERVAGAAAVAREKGQSDVDTTTHFQVCTVPVRSSRCQVDTVYWYSILPRTVSSGTVQNKGIKRILHLPG